MRRANNKVVGGILLLAIVLVAVGYAAITKVGLNIDGTAKSEGNPDNFKVELVGEPQTSGDGTTTATINTADKTQGTMNVSGLNAKGQTAIATYTVKNQSVDLSADLTAKATSTNDEYFEVQCSLDKTTLKAQEQTTMTVKVKLLKTPIDETKENLSTEIGVNIDAEPKQPGEENNGGATTVTSQKPKTTEGTYLPDGFAQVEGTTLENGLTIQDSKGNQYVWIEVPKTSEVYPTAGLNIKNFTTEEYTAIETDLHTYTNDYRDGTSYKDEYYSDEVTGLKSEQYTALKQKMLKSVYKNGGFYIGKYETGIENAPKTDGDENTAPTEIPVIKQNAYPYNYVTCSQAQTLASGMVKSENYTSSLMFGVQWDLVLKYLETKGTAQADLKTDSTSIGNYYDNLWEITNENSKYAPNGSGWTSGARGKKEYNTSILLSTGASETFSKQGIYDIAGNVSEWTLEYTSNSNGPCANRGGFYSNNGDNYPAAYRDGSNTTGYYSIIGFRVSLF
ncbi:MAG: hypothetical protein BHW02_03445 [Clostridium sp. 28_12]|nr:MAG: hypothetical protein BHW02_03445 [Clostridium sp. 28_12]